MFVVLVLAMFELSLLHELAAGRHDPLEIGALPDRIKRYLGCRLPFVYLSKFTFDKIMRKHDHVTFFDLLVLPIILRDGTYIADRAGAVVIAHKHPETGKDYIAAVKVTTDQCELWLSTFHRIEPKIRDRVLRRGRIV